MAPGLPARVVIVCAVLATATIGRSHAQPTTEAGVGTGRRPVAVIDLSGDEAAEVLANELYNILVNHVDLRPVNPTFIRSLKGAFADEEAPAVEAARRARSEAEDFLVNFDHRSAELAAERGTQALHSVRPTPDVLGLYAELAFAAGQAALKLRKPNDATLAFGLSYRLDPAKRPDPTRYPPEIIEAYQLAVTKQAIPAKLDVKGTGTVWIDGIDRGPAPGSFDVSEGMHLVQLSGPERETRGAQVNVPNVPAIIIPDAPASAELKVERARVELARTKDAAARAGGVKRLAALLSVGDAVLIEKGEGGKLMVQTWRDRAPGFSPLVEHEAGKSAAELLHPLAPPRKPVPPPEIIPDPPPIVETPVYRKRWFQGAVATGILAVAATIIVVATQDRMISLGDRDIKQADP